MERMQNPWILMIFQFMRFCYDGHFTHVKLMKSSVFAYCCVCVSTSQFAFYLCETKKIQLFHVFTISGKTCRISLLQGGKCNVRCESHKVASRKTLDFLSFTLVSCRWPYSATRTARAPFRYIFNTFHSKTLLFSRASSLSLHVQTLDLLVSYYETIQNRVKKVSHVGTQFRSKTQFFSFFS